MNTEKNLSINEVSIEDREQLKKLCYDYKVFLTMESEASDGKKDIGAKIKAILDKYGMNGKFVIDVNSITYKEQVAQVADTEKMKKDGIYDKYSKTQHKKPLTIR